MHPSSPEASMHTAFLYHALMTESDASRYWSWVPYVHTAWDEDVGKAVAMALANSVACYLQYGSGQVSCMLSGSGIIKIWVTIKAWMTIRGLV